MTTTTKLTDLRRVLNQGNPNEICDVLKKIRVGDMMTLWKVAFSITAAASLDLTSSTAKAGATITVDGVSYTLDTDEVLPPMGQCVSLRVTASGTATSVGNYTLGDIGSTLLIPPGGANTAVGVARLSDDRKTITFPNTVTAFTLEYFGGPKVALSTSFSQTGV